MNLKIDFLIRIFFEVVVERICLDVVNESFVSFGKLHYPPWHKWLYDSEIGKIKFDK